MNDWYVHSTYLPPFPKGLLLEEVISSSGAYPRVSPSTAIFHSNIPIAVGKRWYSFTQYTGSLFRWLSPGSRRRRNFWRHLRIHRWRRSIWA
ncbi:hypothetical protein K438DRAFT_872456 [Mycena galopus ATCC 62051]|nr:hypothetical protein K438DRAFT_872456 [Mycena galopus ATCC 62051]